MNLIQNIFLLLVKSVNYKLIKVFHFEGIVIPKALKFDPIEFIELVRLAITGDVTVIGECDDVFVIV